jgi:hypothetical protein
MMIEQMELGLGKGRVCPSVNRRQRRLSRANWWFDRMRQAVDGALDGQPPPPPPEQVWMELPRFRRAA